MIHDMRHEDVLTCYAVLVFSSCLCPCKVSVS